jgi:hypothetical protein
VNGRHDSTPTDLNGSEPVSWMAATRRVVAILRTLKRHDLLGALRPGASRPTPDQLRLALEELGIVFVKLGQVLALRRDLLPSAYVAARSATPASCCCSAARSSSRRRCCAGSTRSST